MTASAAVAPDGGNPSSSSTAVAAADARYTFDAARLDELRKSSPWKDDPRYFTGVAVSPSAVMKMVSSCAA